MTTIASLDRMRIPPGAAALAAREVHVALCDGAPVRVRPVRADDLPALRVFLDRRSPSARRLRRLTAAAARWAADVDGHERDGLIATTGDDGAAAIVGHAAWVRLDGERAEIAFETADTLQGRRLATILIAQLAFGARAQGIATFVAEVPPKNHPVLDALRDSGLALHVRSEPGVLRVELPTALTEEARERFERRDANAAVAAMDSVLRPRSLAVVGASPDPGTIGGAIFRKLVEGGYAGALYAVNRRGRNVRGHHCFASIDAIPDAIETAVLAVPAAQWPAVARACAAHAVRTLIVLAGAGAESGAERLASQRELVAICRAGRMRLLGPGCLGAIDTDAGVRLDASFAPTTPRRGHLALLSRNGAAGTALLEQARALGVGLSAFVSVGEQADLSGDDFLEWCAQDERTRAIVLEPAASGNPHAFARLARRVGRVKPILAVTPERSAGGARPAVSRTGALLGSFEAAADALFRQAGVLRADTPRELLDLAALLERQPSPRGPRVAIATNACGSAVRAAGACVAEGLEPLGHPIDLSAMSSPQAIQAAIEAIGASGALDAIIAVLAPAAEDVAAAVRQAGRTLAGRLPLLACFMTAAGAPAVPDEASTDDDGPPLPTFRSPQDAARALGRALAHARWRAAPRGTVPRFEDVRPHEAAAIVARALGAADGAAGRDAAATGAWLEAREAQALLACYGVAAKAIAPAPAAGRELLLGATCDPLFGPVVACSAGGDVAVRLTPVTDRDARELVDALPLAPPVDRPALERLVLRIGALVDAHPEIAELDCDPVLARRGGAVVVNARVRVTPVAPAAPARAHG